MLKSALEMNKLLLLLLKKSYFMQTETRATNKRTKSKIVQNNGFGFSPFAGTRSLKTARVEVADKIKHFKIKH